MRLGLAIRAFFKVCCNRDIAAGFEELVAGTSQHLVSVETPTEPKPVEATRNDAITLLATLQREARFVDIVNEPLDSFSDAQIGAAARDVLTDCGKVLERLFDLQSISPQSEGETCSVPAGFDLGSYRVTGNVSGEPPYTGALIHHGWIAKKCELPQWTGAKESALVVAPAEVEIS